MKKFLKDESGATAIEYALIAVAMTAMLLLAMPVISTAIRGKFNSIASSINGYSG